MKRWTRAVLLTVLAACVEGPGGPGRFGEVSVAPGYRAGYDPAAAGVDLDTAAVVVVRRGTTDTVLDTRVPYAGGTLAWVVDLQAEEESLDVAVELRGGGALYYTGDTAVTVQAGAIASGETHVVAVAYVGPPLIAQVTVSPAAATLGAFGATLQFSAEARDPNGDVLTGITFAWTSADPDTATVDATGLATAAGDGTTTITASAGGVTGSATLTVDLAPSIATVVVTPATATLTALGATQLFTAEARDGNGNLLPGVSFVWASGDPDTATVDSTGLATAAGDGTTTIAATAGGISGTAMLIVDLAPSITSVTVSPTSATLTALGATQQFTAEALDGNGNVLPGVSFTWASSHPDTATVDSTGLARAAGDGTTLITATAAGVSGHATLTVNLAPSIATVMVTPATATLTALSAIQQFTAEARDGNGNLLPGVTFVWASSDPDTATVDSTGLATAVGDGTTTITASAGGVTGSATLTVDLAPSIASVTVTPATATLTALGATQQFTAEALDGNGNILPGIAFSWTSNAPDTATVDSTGLAAAVGDGTTTIAATAGGISGTAMLIVDLAPSITSVTVSPTSATLTALGATQQFTAEALDGNGNVLPGVSFTWASSYPDTATVDSTGLARAAGDGTTLITAAAAGVSGHATLTVNLAPSIATITVTPGAATLTALGATQQFTAEALDGNGNILPGVSFVWTSSNLGTATVDSTGLATAAGTGTTSILATAGTKAGAATLTVRQEVAWVVVTPAAVTFAALDETQALSAAVFDANGHPVVGAAITWTSSTPAVATVDGATGLVTAVADGAATITAAAGTASGTAAVTVDQVVTTVVVTPATALLTAFGATQGFTAEGRDANGHPVPDATFVWASGDPAIASIDPATGLATAVGNGGTTIVADAGTAVGIASLAVSQVVASVTIQPSTVTFTELGATRQLVAVARDANGNLVSGAAFTWSSSDSTVAGVAGGLVTAVANGAATVTAVAGTAAGTATVSVSQVVATVVVTPGGATLTALGVTQGFTAEGRDANGHIVAGVVFSWSSDDPAVATIDAATGVATTQGNGSAVITADAGTAGGSATLVVAQEVATVIVSPLTVSFTALGMRQQLVATGHDANGFVVAGAAFAWSSSDVGVVTVDPGTGLVTALANGDATITVDAGTATGTATVTVHQVIASVVVAPDSVTLIGIEPVQLFTAVARDANGYAIASTTFTWSSSNRAVAKIDASGLAECIGSGATTIVAGAGGVTGSAALVCNPSTPPPPDP